MITPSSAPALPVLWCFTCNTETPLEDSGGYYGHNDYLQFLQEGGPLLLLFSILPLALIGRILITRYHQSSKSEQDQPLMTAAFALAAATFFIHAAADFIFYNLALALLTGFYLSLAYHQTPKNPPKYSIQLSQPKMTGIFLCLALGIAWSTLAINSYISRKMEWQDDWGSIHPQQKLDAQTILFYHHLSPTHPH